jgi:hypothetical protein
LLPGISTLALELLEAASVRLGIDKVQSREIALEELDRPSFSSTWLIVGGNDPRHRRFYRRTLMLIEKSCGPATAACLWVCHRKSSMRLKPAEFEGNNTGAAENSILTQSGR